MTNTQNLLAQYVEAGSEAAFRELLARYIDLVYSAAVRLVGGDAHLAQDVTQTVFVDLAKAAHKLPKDVMLGGWLHRHTLFVAATMMRGQRRREARERQVVEMNALPDHSEANLAQVSPVLDEAINELGAEDRTAILLRFFEQLDFRAVGAALGSSEEAARKRVSRALERLHCLLRRRGVSLSAAALGTVLASEAVTAAPAGLAAIIASSGLGSATAGGGAMLNLVKFMTMTKLKLGIIGALAAATVTSLVVHDQVKLREENRALREQLDREAQLAAENERLSSMIAQTAQTNSQLLPDAQFKELLRLRGEVTRLRAEAQEAALSRIASARNPAAQLRKELNQMPEKNIPELQLLHEDKWAEDASRVDLKTEDGVRQALGNLRRAAKLRFAYRLGQALNNYVKAANGQLPSDISELKAYFDPPVDDALLQRYELLHTGKLKDFRPGEPLVGEKAPVDDRYDTLFKIALNGYHLQGIGKWTDSGATYNFPWSTSQGSQVSGN